MDKLVRVVLKAQGVDPVAASEQDKAKATAIASAVFDHLSTVTVEMEKAIELAVDIHTQRDDDYTYMSDHDKVYLATLKAAV